jgi:hypothetical protein
MGKPQKLHKDHPGKGGWKQAVKDKDDTTDTGDTNEHQDQGVVVWYGDAWAIGEDTFTQVDTTGKIVDHGRVTTAKINIKAVAAAEGDSALTSTDTWVDASNFDISRLKITNISLEHDGVSYDVSIAKFKGVDLPDHVKIPDKAKHKEKVVVIEREGDADLDFDLDGNVATVTFDVEVHGDDTLANADAYALAIEDALSQSTILIETAVG